MTPRINPAVHTGTCSTTPAHIWVATVVELAGVSVEQMETHCTRARLHRWYAAGEPTWMAAESLRTMVSLGERSAA